MLIPSPSWEFCVSRPVSPPSTSPPGRSGNTPAAPGRQRHTATAMTPTGTTCGTTTILVPLRMWSGQNGPTPGDYTTCTATLGSCALTGILPRSRPDWFAADPATPSRTNAPRPFCINATLRYDTATSASALSEHWRRERRWRAWCARPRATRSNSCRHTRSGSGACRCARQTRRTSSATALCCSAAPRQAGRSRLRTRRSPGRMTPGTT